MIWSGIIDAIMVGPWRVQEGVKITGESYITVLKEHLEPCGFEGAPRALLQHYGFEGAPRALLQVAEIFTFKRTTMFIHDIIPHLIQQRRLVNIFNS